jgi:hypothetical protein
MYEFLEAERASYTIRLPASRVLQERIGYLLKRPVGRPLHEVRRSLASFGVPLCASQPVLCGAGGTLAGMMLNFTLSRQVAFPSS